jgi:hypothetical protein
MADPDDRYGDEDGHDHYQEDHIPVYDQYAGDGYGSNSGGQPQQLHYQDQEYDQYDPNVGEGGGATHEDEGGYSNGYYDANYYDQGDQTYDQAQPYYDEQQGEGAGTHDYPEEYDPNSGAGVVHDEYGQGGDYQQSDQVYYDDQQYAQEGEYDPNNADGAPYDDYYQEGEDYDQQYAQEGERFDAYAAGLSTVNQTEPIPDILLLSFHCMNAKAPTNATPEAKAKAELSWEPVLDYLRNHTPQEVSDAMTERGENEMTALHYACRNCPPADVVNVMLSATIDTCQWEDGKSFGDFFSFRWKNSSRSCVQSSQGCLWFIFRFWLAPNPLCLVSSNTMPSNFLDQNLFLLVRFPSAVLVVLDRMLSRAYQMLIPSQKRELIVVDGHPFILLWGTRKKIGLFLLKWLPCLVLLEQLPLPMTTVCW